MLACVHYGLPTDHPYPLLQALAAAALIATYLVWRHRRPPPVAVLRVPALGAAIAMIGSLCISTSGMFHDVRSACVLTLETSLLLTGCLLAELLARARRVPLAIALARSYGDDAIGHDARRPRRP